MRTSADVARLPSVDDWRRALRGLEVKINLHVALGSTDAANLAPTGCLAAVVTKHGGDEALDKYPEARAFLAPAEEHVGARRGCGWGVAPMILG